MKFAAWFGKQQMAYRKFAFCVTSSPVSMNEHDKSNMSVGIPSTGMLYGSAL